MDSIQPDTAPAFHMQERRMNRDELESAAADVRKMNRLWRDPEARKRFEQEAGLDPIISGNSLEVEAQHQSGRTEEYHAKFGEWAQSQEI
jgi:hypothetical protein